MTQFAFLRSDFPDVLAHAQRAEGAALSDPRGSCFYARLALETAVKWLYANDRGLRKPYEDALSALIHEATFRALVGQTIFTKARIIKDHGNAAVHDARAVPSQNAVVAVRELFHVCYWLVRNYGRAARPDPGLTFSADALPRAVQVEASTLAKLQKIADDREADARRLAEAEEARIRSEADRLALDAEVRRLQDEIAAIRAANQAVPDGHDYNEDETRDAFIDLLLSEAGWRLADGRDREFPVRGMPNTTGDGFVDYVLWGDDGKPLALVEAKRTRRDAREGQQQAKLYADCLQAQYGQRPLIFYSNGYEHWCWDDLLYPPRAVQGFPKKDELLVWMQRKSTRHTLSNTSIDPAIVERYYQTRAIRRVGEAFERDRERNALLVMATGSGKTRTVIALVDQLMRANWVKRVLFLADRRALVKQAHNNFKKHLPSAASASLIERHDPTKNDHNAARVCVATYPTMMGLIDELTATGERRFGASHFDLIVIDEAHRSVYRKYRAIFEYFDSLLIGLTATPRDEIDRDTYSLFELERGVPTDAYDLDQAVADGFLVPPTSISVPTRFHRDGIRYDQLPEEEQAEWDELEWEGLLPEADEISAAALNQWLFNISTVDKVLEHVMTHGLKVADGDRLGKTIIFAKNHRHAQFIGERFDINYPHLAGSFARVIDNKTEYAETLIDAFSKSGDAPHIAISVDMLDTGIDVPEVVNLVFFKVVRSRTKFWQMIGRGTRLCPDLFGPGQHKDTFLIFDFCENFEFFQQNPNPREGAVAGSISQRLFRLRLDIATQIDDMAEDARSAPLGTLRDGFKARLRDEVRGMPLDNFVVRPKRRAVEKYQTEEAWSRLDAEEREELSEEVAGLPTALTDDDIAAKQFDVVMLSGINGLLVNDRRFVRCQEKARELASQLEALGNIPMVAEQLALIQEAQTDEYWQDIDAWTMEQLRQRLRALVKLIEPGERQIVYTDFEDQIGPGAQIDLPEIGNGTDRGRFQRKVRHFLEQHRDHITIRKLHRNEQLTPTDLAELERIMVSEAVATGEELQALGAEGGLGLFIRSLIGLDRDAAKDAFAAFLAGRNFSANQIEFINLIIEHLTARGAVEPDALYESPFTDLDDQGLTGVFPDTADVHQIVQILRVVSGRAVA